MLDSPARFGVLRVAGRESAAQSESDGLGRLAPSCAWHGPIPWNHPALGSTAVQPWWLECSRNGLAREAHGADTGEAALPLLILFVLRPEVLNRHVQY